MNVLEMINEGGRFDMMLTLIVLMIISRLFTITITIVDVEVVELWYIGLEE